MKNVPLIMTAVAALAAGPALAHTELTETIPADHATIATAPENVELKFSEPVRLTALAIERDETDKQSLGPLPTEALAAFSVALPAALGDGRYVVTWRALSEDTHVMSGEFMFAVGAAASQDAHLDDAAHAGDGAHADHAATPAAEHHDDHGAH